jgi:hypothetical protein
MPITLDGSGSLGGINNISTSASVNISGTELGYLDNTTSAIQTQINTAGGLVKIVDAALSGSSVSINSCFSATYNVYRILIERVYVAAGVPTLRFRLRTGGVDASTNYNYRNLLGSTVWTLGVGSNQNAFELASVTTSEMATPIDLTIFSPFIAVGTGFQSLSTYEANTTGPSINFYTGGHTTAASYESFTLLPTSSTFSGGTVRVYGYRN